MSWLHRPAALRPGSAEWVEAMAVRVAALGAAAALIWLSVPLAVAHWQS